MHVCVCKYIWFQWGFGVGVPVDLLFACWAASVGEGDLGPCSLMSVCINILDFMLTLYFHVSKYVSSNKSKLIHIYLNIYIFIFIFLSAYRYFQQSIPPWTLVLPSFIPIAKAAYTSLLMLTNKFFPVKSFIRLLSVILGDHPPPR